MYFCVQATPLLPFTNTIYLTAEHNNEPVKGTTTIFFSLNLAKDVIISSKI